MHPRTESDVLLFFESNIVNQVCLVDDFAAILTYLFRTDVHENALPRWRRGSSFSDTSGYGSTVRLRPWQRRESRGRGASEADASPAVPSEIRPDTFLSREGCTVRYVLRSFIHPQEKFESPGTINTIHFQKLLDTSIIKTFSFW